MNKSILTILSFLALTLLCSCSEFVPMNYTDTILTGGQIEATFLKNGKDNAEIKSNKLYQDVNINK